MVNVTDPETGEVWQEEKPYHEGMARKSINKLVRRIKQMFGWAVEEKMLPITVHATHMRVQGTAVPKPSSKANQSTVTPLPLRRSSWSAAMRHLGR